MIRDLVFESWVSGVPKGLARARTRAVKRRNGKTGTQVYPSPVGALWRRNLDYFLARPVQPLSGPVRLAMEFYLPRPKRLCRKGDPMGPVFHTSTPDLDNLVKLVSDFLNRRWYVDDAQVAEIEASKRYHAKDGEPGLWLRMWELHEK